MMNKHLAPRHKDKHVHVHVKPVTKQLTGIKQSNTTTVLSKLDISKYIMNHMIGEDHSKGHRIIVGIIIGVFGVIIADVVGAEVHHILIAKVTASWVGFGIHGVGWIPIIEHLAEKGKRE